MSTQEYKDRVMAWLPIMMDLELMGVDPVKEMFQEPMTIESIERSYVALSRCKDKYPKWYGLMNEYARL